MNLIISFFLSNIIVSSGFIIPTKITVRKLEDKCYKIYEPVNNDESKRINQCIFYPGLYGQVPYELYQSFLTKLASKNLTVYALSPDIKDSYQALKSITYNEPTTIIAHSSGASDALEACKYMDNIDQLILLDPVDFEKSNDRFEFSLPFFPKQEDKDKSKKIFIPRHVKRVVFINAKKSYEWSWFPIKPPFIPLFSLSKDLMECDNVEMIESKDHGHSDILDYYWGNIMHATLSRGLEDRNELLIDQYHDWLSNELADKIIENTQELEYCETDEDTSIYLPCSEEH